MDEKKQVPPKKEEAKKKPATKAAVGKPGNKIKPSRINPQESNL
jgi:hypothetical protein